ncbi:hypothetical protein G4X40_06465 [Rhodococcus sp. D2-41]|uniref:Uncharacterized protein n=1 Tax=Speluncibacter jeojiensis TaxID=2710754 RepID=A0A9X4RDB2_9ACTN|nr:hypothetical protein [Rhodococcus sp. D2-41]MDG3009788.1 hypothetical protein [Rhodococcus sp. D2-41]MDG3014539.1 hypothetical protein [Corynebacteriales bacterium D3-21]
MALSDDFAVATALRDEIAATHAGFGNPSALIAALWDAVPAIVVDEHHVPMVAEFGGVSVPIADRIPHG